MTWGKRVWFCLWASCLFLGGNGPSRAADWVLTSSMETRAEFLNNIFYSGISKKSDYILSAIPNLNFTYNTEVTQIGGNLRLTGEHYLQNPNLDTINQYYTISASTLATSRLKLNLAVNYLSTTDSTESVLATNVFTIRQRTNALTVSPGFTYNLTERWSTDFLYNFYNVNYQMNPFNSYNTHTLNNRLNYLFNEKTSFIVSLTTSYSKYQKIDNSIRSLGPQLGFNHKISENWDITFLGGANFSTVESSVSTASSNNIYGFVNQSEEQKQRTSSINPFVTISANSQWQTGGLNINYTRSQSASAYLNQQQYNSFKLVFNQKITEKFSLAINPYFNITSNQGGRSKYDQYYYGVMPRITYKLTERTSVGANYHIGYVEYVGVQRNNYNINDVYIFLNYTYPIHFQR